MKLASFDTRKVELLLNFREKARKQAERNALTLFVMAIGFILTWAFILAATVWAVSHGD